MQTFNVGALVPGAPVTSRALCRHAETLAAFTDGTMIDREAVGEAYLSHFAYGPEMRTHYAAHRGSVAGYTGPCWCRWLVWDIDRADDLGAALADTRRLVTYLGHRYEPLEPVVFYSGSKGFHVLLELVHAPPPAVGFHRVAKAFALGVARAAGVAVDESIYDIAHILRLPNTKHGKTGRYKRRLSLDELAALDAGRIVELAAYPWGEDLRTTDDAPEQLAIDWQEAEKRSQQETATRATIRRDAAVSPDTRAPRWFLELLRFGVQEGERHQTLFRAAAWLTEQGAPPSLSHALLTEPGQDLGLTPADVDRQICCGVEHAQRQRAATDPHAAERWAIQHEADPLPPGALDFPYGALAPKHSDGGPA